ncbi:hypothetical protein KJ632_00340 [Patescibacteria group bacterium]|nr:hypothetical protein [Patescibacteria group bacterium]
MSKTKKHKNKPKQPAEDQKGQSVEVFEEDGKNTLSFNDEDSYCDIDVNPESKIYHSSLILKDDAYHRKQKYEYRIQTNPIKVEIRLIERMDEPPEHYCVKDGVVLESDILAEKGELLNEMTKDFISGLKKGVEWHEEWTGSPISMYLLSKHPDIIPPNDYRRYLRLISEKIKTANQKIEETLATDKTGLKITDEYTGRAIWYPKSKQDKMSKKEIEKAVKNVEKIQKKLFEKKSPEYVGISQDEFRSSKEVLKHVEMFLDKKSISARKKVTPNISSSKVLILSLALTLLLSWIVSWFVDVNPFLIFIIVQAIAFAQSIIGGWIGKALDK